MKIENIKFKAKRLDGKGWVCGYFYEENGNTYIVEKRQKESMLNRNITYQVDPSTVCQFTGLKDCKGNELYEHDVIKNYPFIPSEIVWSEELSGYYLTHANGKIYEKPLGYYLSLGKFIAVGNKFDKEK
jgi:uncharacterized phage protein (TIGR01671 family)|nr:MAG TPA_asm: YopX protein [Caudoviricetes sp.]